MSYQRERDEFIARMSREGLPIDITRALLRAATTMQRYAELACSSEAADRDRVPCPASRNTLKSPNRYPCLCDSSSTDYGKHDDVPRITVLDWRVETRVRAMIVRENDRILTSGAPINVKTPALWAIDTQGDPRAYVLRVIPPSYAERNAGRDRFNMDTIGVPSGPTRLRW